jgi:hypothetical protein
MRGEADADVQDKRACAEGNSGMEETVEIGHGGSPF